MNPPPSLAGTSASCSCSSGGHFDRRLSVCFWSALWLAVHDRHWMVSATRLRNSDLKDRSAAFLCPPNMRRVVITRRGLVFANTPWQHMQMRFWGSTFFQTPRGAAHPLSSLIEVFPASRFECCWKSPGQRYECLKHVLRLCSNHKTSFSNSVHFSGEPSQAGMRFTFAMACSQVHCFLVDQDALTIVS